MKRNVLAILMAVLMVFSLTACGGAAKEEATMDMMTSTSGGGNLKAEAESPAFAPSAPMEDAKYDNSVDYEMGETIEAETQSQEQNPLAERKFIITAWMELETTEFDQAVTGLTELVEKYGGYFETSSVANRKSGSRWADYTARIPANRYEAFMNQAGELCHETWREANAEDISEAYYDTQGRLKTQQIKLERLQALLAKAELMEDIITIESAISETEWQIDNLSGTLRHYDSKVNYATVNINLQEVYKLSNVEVVPDSFGERMGASFSEGISDFVDTLEDLAVDFAYSWIWWVLIVAAVIVVVRVARKKGVRKPVFRRKKKDDKQDET